MKAKASTLLILLGAMVFGIGWLGPQLGLPLELYGSPATVELSSALDKDAFLCHQFPAMGVTEKWEYGQYNFAYCHVGSSIGRDACFQYRAFIKFTGLPNATVAGNVTMAKLVLYVWSAEGGHKIYAHRATTAWSESSPDAQSSFNLPTDLDEGSFTTGTGWKIMTVTETVRSWINGSHANYGFKLTGDEGNYDSYVVFRSREYSDASQRPKLYIWYTNATATTTTATTTTGTTSLVTVSTLVNGTMTTTVVTATNQSSTTSGWIQLPQWSLPLDAALMFAGAAMVGVGMISRVSDERKRK